MLGRLKMDVDQCINAYQHLLLCSFPQRSLHLRHAKFEPQRCGSELRRILAQSGYEENALFRESGPSCRVYVHHT
jgi:hypothetical protein